MLVSATRQKCKIFYSSLLSAPTLVEPHMPLWRIAASMFSWNNILEKVLQKADGLRSFYHLVSICRTTQGLCVTGTCEPCLHSSHAQLTCTTKLCIWISKWQSTIADQGVQKPAEFSLCTGLWHHSASCKKSHHIYASTMCFCHLPCAQALLLPGWSGQQGELSH